MQYIGSTSRCGCDFPHATLQNGEWPEIEYLEYVEQDAERVAINKGNREALVELLRESGDNVVELYGIWDGDFVEAPKVQENIAAETILDSGFIFNHCSPWLPASTQYALRALNWSSGLFFRFSCSACSPVCGDCGRKLRT